MFDACFPEGNLCTVSNYGTLNTLTKINYVEISTESLMWI